MRRSDGGRRSGSRRCSRGSRVRDGQSDLRRLRRSVSSQLARALSLTESPFTRTAHVAEFRRGEGDSGDARPRLRCVGVIGWPGRRGRGCRRWCLTAQSGIRTVGIAQPRQVGRGPGERSDVHDWWTFSSSGLGLAFVLLLALERAEQADRCGVAGSGVARGRDPADSGGGQCEAGVVDRFPSGPASLSPPGGTDQADARAADQDVPGTSLVMAGCPDELVVAVGDDRRR